MTTSTTEPPIVVRMAIVGTRRNSEEMRERVQLQVRSLARSVTIVTGDCPTGVDAWVKHCAERYNYVCVVVHARGRDRAALLERNTVIADLATVGVAFPDPQSRGTWDTVNKLKDRGKHVAIVEVP